MSHEYFICYDPVIHPHTMSEKKKKYTFGKRFSQFLSKILWHLNQQSIPNYSCIKQKRSTSLSSKRKSVLKSSMDRYYIRSQYPACYRTCSMRERTSTLSSIPEE